jgi:hypothetical protein
MKRKDFWPKEGKLKKSLFILAIVIVSSLLITLFEEKTNLKLSKRIGIGIALLSVGIWLYNPGNKKRNTSF